MEQSSIKRDPPHPAERQEHRQQDGRITHRLSSRIRAAAQRAEQQRIVDYYARTTKEQGDRENAEARELFLEQQARLSVNRSLKP